MVSDALDVGAQAQVDVFDFVGVVGESCAWGVAVFEDGQAGLVPARPGVLSFHALDDGVADGGVGQRDAVVFGGEQAGFGEQTLGGRGGVAGRAQDGAEFFGRGVFEGSEGFVPGLGVAVGVGRELVEQGIDAIDEHLLGGRGQGGCEGEGVLGFADGVALQGVVNEPHGQARVAFAAFDDGGSSVFVEGQDVFDPAFELAGVQGAQVEGGVMGGVVLEEEACFGERVDVVCFAGDEGEDRQLWVVLSEVLDEVQGFVGPLGVFEADDERPRGR